MRNEARDCVAKQCKIKIFISHFLATWALATWCMTERLCIGTASSHCSLVLRSASPCSIMGFSGSEESLDLLGLNFLPPSAVIDGPKITSVLLLWANLGNERCKHLGGGGGHRPILGCSKRLADTQEPDLRKKRPFRRGGLPISAVGTSDLAALVLPDFLYQKPYRRL